MIKKSRFTERKLRILPFGIIYAASEAAHLKPVGVKLSVDLDSPRVGCLILLQLKKVYEMHSEDEKTITLWEALQYFGNKKKPTRKDKVLHTLIELSLLGVVFIFIPFFIAVPLSRVFNLDITGIGIIWALTALTVHFAGKGLKVKKP